MDRVFEVQAIAEQNCDPERLELLKLHRKVIKANQETLKLRADQTKQKIDSQDYAQIRAATAPNEVIPELQKPVISRPRAAKVDAITDLARVAIPNGQGSCNLGLLPNLDPVNLAPPLMIPGVMLLAGGTVVLVVIASRQFMRLKYKLKRCNWGHFQQKFKRQKLPVYVNGRRYSIGTAEYFEPVELGLFDMLADGTIEGIPVPQLRSEFLNR